MVEEEGGGRGRMNEEDDGLEEGGIVEEIKGCVGRVWSRRRRGMMMGRGTLLWLRGGVHRKKGQETQTREGEDTEECGTCKSPPWKQGMKQFRI